MAFFAKNTIPNHILEKKYTRIFMSEEVCRNKILSQDFYDFIIPSYRGSTEIVLSDSQACIVDAGFGYRILYVEESIAGDVTVETYGYNGIPNCYTLLDTEAMSQTGISAVQNYPTLQLSGDGILIGFLDTGIDYENEIFRNLDGGTKIAAIWDQTIQNGVSPKGFDYGSEYTREQINEALRAEEPMQIVPSKDTNGHGTFLASIAAGNRKLENQFQGAAPGASLAVVKLKEAKEFLREFYVIREGAVCYQETDIMLGLKYLHELATELGMPLVICVALGTNFGGHNGSSILAMILQEYAKLENRCVVIGAGNEANERHHFEGKLADVTEVQEVEIRVEQEGGGFVAELWATLPDIVTAYLVSPSGERSPTISIRQGSRYTLNFPFDQTIVTVEYRLLMADNDSQLIFLRFQTPRTGIWKIGVSGLQILDGTYHIWLSMKEFQDSQSYFLEANPDVTLTEPGSTFGAITVSYYDGTDSAVDINSGRGYTRSMLVKPDFAAPGVNVIGAGQNGRFVRRSGSSIAAGITAGACALLLEWLKKQPELRGVTTSQVANIILFGANRGVLPDYPNREWGYGTLDIYQSLDRLRRL